MGEAQGATPLWRSSVPDAALRLVQASGRLLRTERDGGKVTSWTADTDQALWSRYPGFTAPSA